MLSSFSGAARAGRVALAALILFGSVRVRAHIGGPPQLVGKPGDILTYIIKSDVAHENMLTDYSLVGTYDTNIISVLPASPYKAYPDGIWAIYCKAAGTTAVTFAWSYPHHQDRGEFKLEMIVQPPGSSTQSSENYPNSATDGDPVNLFTGEFLMLEEPDMDLGGPMPLFFQRYYASGLGRDTLVQSPLGINWACNFDWRLIRAGDLIDVVTWKGRRVRFERAGAGWKLGANSITPYQLIERGPDFVFADPREHREYTFNASGFLTQIADGRGNAHHLSYNGGVLLEVSDGLGRTLKFVNNGFHQLASVSDGQRTVRFGYFGTILASVADVLNNVTSFRYDNLHAIPGLLVAKTLPLKNIPLTMVYDPQGRVTQQTLGDGHVRTFSYLPGNTTTLTEGNRPPRTFVHSPEGDLLSFTDEHGKIASLGSYTGAQPAGIRDREGNITGLTWDQTSGNPAALTNASGEVTQFRYQPRTHDGFTHYELVEIRYYDGTSQSLTYDMHGNIVSRTDPGGFTWRYAYNERGQILAVTNPAGGVFKQTFNSDGTVATRTDGETGFTSYAYDALRRPVAVTNSDGAVRRFVLDAADRVTNYTDQRGSKFLFSYDLNGNLLTVTDPNGQVAHFAYDGMDRLNRQTDRAGGVTLASFNEMNQVTLITNRNGHVAVFSRDAAYRLTEATDPLGGKWRLGYDDEGGLISFTDPLGRTSSSGYDSLRYPAHQTNALGETVKIDRDSMARVTTVVDPVNRTNAFGYDSRGLLSSAGQPGLPPAKYEYNNLGLLSSVTDPEGRRWSFEYSPWGRPTKVTDPLNRSETAKYDIRGRPSEIIFADGATRTNDYDPAGNLVSQKYSDGTSLEFTYDALNRLATANSLTFGYDPEGRITNTVNSALNFTASYDLDGRLIEIGYDGNRLVVTYQYDSLDRLVQVSDSLSGAQVSFQYDASGLLTNVLRSNGVNGIYEYDADRRLTRLKEGGFLDLAYTLNKAGEPSSVQLTGPLSFSKGVSPATLQFNAAHQIATAGFAYDARGRLTASPGHTYAFDAASRLIRVDNVTFTYNALGGLETRSENGSAKRFFYNHAIMSAPIVAEQVEGSAAFSRYYIWTPSGRLLYMIEGTAGNDVRFYHFDRSGSTLALTDRTGAVTDAYAHTPYGVLLARTGTNGQPFTFIGARGVRAEGSDGLFQMRARYYQASTARFLTRDPRWPSLNRPARLNPYQYARQNPLRFFDPSGLEEVDLTFVSEDVGIFGNLFVGSDWFSSIDDLLAKIKAKLGPNDCLRKLTVVNHGSEGCRGFIQFDSENYISRGNNDTPFFSGQNVQDRLRELATLFCRDGSLIFRVCRAGEGTEGDVVLKAIANLVRVPVTGPEDEIKAAPWGGISVPWKTVNPDNYIPPGLVVPPSDIAPVTASSRTTR